MFYRFLKLIHAIGDMIECFAQKLLMSFVLGLEHWLRVRSIDRIPE